LPGICTEGAKGLYVWPVNPRYFKALQRFRRKRWNIQICTTMGRTGISSRLSVGQTPDMARMCKAAKENRNRRPFFDYKYWLARWANEV